MVCRYDLAADPLLFSRIAFTLEDVRYCRTLHWHCSAALYNVVCSFKKAGQGGCAECWGDGAGDRLELADPGAGPGPGADPGAWAGPGPGNSIQACWTPCTQVIFPTFNIN